MPHRETARPRQRCAHLVLATGVLYIPYLGATELLVIVILLAPLWGREVLYFAAAYRLFREGRDPDARLD